MNDEQEMEIARATLLKEARRHVTEKFGPIENEHEYVPNIEAAVEPRVFYVPDETPRYEVARIALEHGARMAIGGTIYRIRFGYDKGHFTYWFDWTDI